MIYDILYGMETIHQMIDFLFLSPRSRLLNMDQVFWKSIEFVDADYLFIIKRYKIDHFGPILDDRLKEKILKPSKGVLCIHFRVCLSVCLCVCLSVRGLQSTPFDLRI